METIELGLIDPSPANLRRRLGDLKDLTASIKSVGILEPLIVRPNGAEGRFELVAGHRRHAAAKKAKLDQVPVVVREDLDDAAVTEAMLIENLQRHDLAPCEEADGYLKLVETGMTVKTLAKRIGRSAEHVSGRLKLLELPPDVQDGVDEGTVTLDNATKLLKVTGDKRWERLDDKTRDTIIRTTLSASSWYSPVQDLSRAVWDMDRKEAIAKAKERHGELFVAAKDEWSLPGIRLGKGHGELPLGAAAHKKLDCHRYTVDARYGHAPTTVSICANWQCHVDGTSDLQLPDDHPFAERHKRSSGQAEPSEWELQRQERERQTAMAVDLARRIVDPAAESTVIAALPASFGKILSRHIFATADPSTIEDLAVALDLEPVDVTPDDAGADDERELDHAKAILDRALLDGEPGPTAHLWATALVLYESVAQGLGWFTHSDLNDHDAWILHQVETALNALNGAETE